MAGIVCLALTPGHGGPQEQHGRGVIENMHSTDVASPPTPRASVWAFTFNLSHAPISVERLFSVTLLPGEAHQGPARQEQVAAHRHPGGDNQKTLALYSSLTWSRFVPEFPKMTRFFHLIPLKMLKLSRRHLRRLNLIVGMSCHGELLSYDWSRR